MLETQLSRRDLLKGGALVVTFALTPSVGAQSQSGEKSVNPDDVGAFLAIDAKGGVTLYSGKVDLGTGAVTALTQMCAEELSVPFARVTTIQGDTALTPSQGPTYASLSVQQGGMQIRRAAATAREALLKQAATKLGVAKAELTVRDGSSSQRAPAARGCPMPKSLAIAR